MRLDGMERNTVEHADIVILYLFLQWCSLMKDHDLQTDMLWHS